jgi:hypothetical protein
MTVTVVLKRFLQTGPASFHCGYLLIVGALLLGPTLFQQEKANMFLTGVVLTAAGEPIPDVWIGGGPEQATQTDAKGQFQISAGVAVLRFVKDKFQPTFLVVNPGMADLKVTLRPSTNDMKVPACSLPAPHASRMEGMHGLFFDLPSGEVDVSGGTDVDYSVYVVKPRRGSGALHFWFGVYAMSIEPDDDRFIDSIRVRQRNVLNPKGQTIGLDSSGKLASGEVWRKMCILAEGAEYQSPSRDVTLFDRIIDSACLDPQSPLAN